MLAMGITRTEAGHACAEPPPVSALTRISDIEGNQLKSFRTEGLQDSALGPESHVEADSPTAGTRRHPVGGRSGISRFRLARPDVAES